MSYLGPNNALAWAHFRLRGGWSRSAAFAGGALVVLLMLIVGLTRLNPADASRILYGWSTGLLVLQAAVLVVYIPGRISTAIRQDIQTKLIESHRLMPTPPLEAISGYVVGAALQPLLLSAALFLLGVYTCHGAALELSRWVMATGVLLAFAGFVWVLSAYVSFAARIGPALMFMPLFLLPALVGGTGGLATLPGVLVLLSPMIGQSVFDLRGVTAPGSVPTLPAVYAIALAAQVYFAAICFIAAGRKYRSSDAAGVDALLGLLLLAGWTGVTVIGLRGWEDYRPAAWRGWDSGAGARVIASLIVALLFAVTPVAASAWEHARWRRHERLRDPAPMRRPLPAALVLVVATLLAVAIPYVEPELDIPQFRARLGWSAGVIAVTLAGLYFLYAFAYSLRPRAGVVAFLWVMVTWGGPVMADLVRFGFADKPDAEPLATMASGSPLGALVILWDDANHRRALDPLAGLILLAAINAIPLAAWLTLRLRERGAAGALDAGVSG